MRRVRWGLAVGYTAVALVPVPASAEPFGRTTPDVARSASIVRGGDAEPTTVASASDRIGTYPAAASAVLSALAFVLAAAAFLQTRREREREQADAVYAWQVVSSATGLVKVEVRNASNQPIWGVAVQLRERGQPIGLEPSELPPRVDCEPADVLLWEWKDAALRNLEPQPLVTFADADGREWRRVGAALVRVDGRRRRTADRMRRAVASLARAVRRDPATDGRA